MLLLRRAASSGLRRFSSSSLPPDLFAMLGVEVCERSGLGTDAAFPPRCCALSWQRRFDLDADALHGSYKALMVRLHPDRFSTASREEQREAADRASSITDAYTELRHPHRRASHLLELLGRPLSEADDGALLGPPFLMEIMELREELEASPDEGRLAELRKRNQRQLEELGSELALAFAASQLEDARRLTAELQYLHRIEEEIDLQIPAV